MSERNLVGYADSKPEIIWPNGARVAVSVVVNFEEGAELQVGDGDPTSELVGEVRSVVSKGHRDLWVRSKSLLMVPGSVCGVFLKY